MRVCSYCHLVLTDADSTCPRDGAPGAETELTPVSEGLAEKFHDWEPFARGATGTCYIAVQNDSGYRGVLKVLPMGGVSDASDRMRLKRELRKQTALTNNSLVRIIDGGEIGQDLWLFRDTIEGESLAQRLRRDGPLELGDALAITAQIATALDELHRTGLLHRDVKPGHVMLSGEPGRVPLVTLIDAGVAARVESGSVFALLGTPAYMSPEQAAGKVVSFRSDLYSLGCVLYEMLAGYPPFSGPDVQSVLKAHEEATVPKLDVQMPASVEALIEAMLAKEPRRRPFSAQQVRRTLEPYLPESTPPAMSGTRTAAGNVKAPGAPPTGARGSFAAREDHTQEVDIDQIVLPGEDMAGQTLDLTLADIERLREHDEAVATLALGTIRLTWDELATLRDDAGAADRVLLSVDVDAQGVPTLRGIGPGPRIRAADAPNLDFSVLAALVMRGAPAQASEDVEEIPAEEIVAEELAVEDIAAEEMYQDVPVQGEADEEDATTLFKESAADGVPPPPAGEAREAEPLDELAAAQVGGSEPPAVGRPSVNFDVESLFEDEALDPATTHMVAPDAPSDEEQRRRLIFTAVGAVMVLLFLWLVLSGDEEPEQVAEVGQQAQDVQASAAAEPEPAAEEQPAEEREQPAAAEQPAEDPPAEPPASNEPEAAATPNAGQASRSSAPSSGIRGPGGGVRKPAAKPPSTVDHKAEARQLYQAGKYKAAAAAYQRATRQNPRDAGAFAGLGAARLAAGDARGSIQAYQSAVRLNPGSSGFHAALGRAYARAGNKAQAQKSYRKALQLNPNNRAAAAALQSL